MRKLLFALALSVPVTAQATIYQCEVDGAVAFSDRPCGSDSKKVQVDPVTIGGRLDTGATAARPANRARSRNSFKQEKDCPFINSTDMRRYTIQKKVVKGMKPKDVRHAWGSPSVISTGRTIQWAYHYDDGRSSYVYFRNGCVDSSSGRYPQN